MKIASFIFPATAVCPRSHHQHQFGYGKASASASKKLLCSSAVNIPRSFKNMKLGCSHSQNGENSIKGIGGGGGGSSSTTENNHLNKQQQYPEQYQPWEPGNVESDFQELRSAVRKSRTDMSLTFWESQFEDDYLANNRRPLQPDFIRYIAVPLASSALLSSSMLKSSTIVPTRQFTVAIRIGAFLMDAYYFIFCLVLPLLLWPLLRREDARLKEIERKNERISPWNDRRLKPMYEDRCNNHCRVGSTVSLYQYGKHIFELKRANQPRPLTKFTVILQQYVDSMTKMLPNGLLLDLTSILCLIRQRNDHLTLNLIQKIPRFFSYGFLASIVPPLIHIIAFLRLIRIFYGKNESSVNSFITSDPRTTVYSTETDYLTTERLTLKSGDQHSVTWRWCLKWRRRRRVIDTIERWWILFIADFDLNKFFEPDYYDSSERELQKILSYEDRNYMSNNNDDIVGDSQEQVLIPMESRLAGMQAPIAVRHRQEYKKAEGKRHVSFFFLEK